MKLEEMEAQRIAQAAPVDAEFEDTEEHLITDTLEEGITLLKQTSILMSYLADPILCRTLTKKERDALDRLNEKVDAFVDEAESLYGDD